MKSPAAMQRCRQGLSEACVAARMSTDIQRILKPNAIGEARSSLHRKHYALPKTHHRVDLPHNSSLIGSRHGIPDITQTNTQPCEATPTWMNRPSTTRMASLRRQVLTTLCPIVCIILFSVSQATPPRNDHVDDTVLGGVRRPTDR